MKGNYNLMAKSRRSPAWIVLTLFVMAMAAGCPGTPTPAEPDEPQRAVPVVPNDSVVAAQIVSIKSVTGVFPWEVELHLSDSQDVPGYVNLTKERVGQTLTARTREDMAPYQAEDSITGNLSLAGDEKGTFFHLSNVSKKDEG